MSAFVRLGIALVELIRRTPGDAKYVVIEAADPQLATSISEYWNTDPTGLPRLAVAAHEPSRFGEYGLVNGSAAGLRNRTPPEGGCCVVVVEGFELAERQSINLFDAISPGDLLRTKNNLMILSEARQPVRRDGAMAAIREALVTLPASARPSALQTAEFFESVARGGNPLEQLPTLGGFKDPGISEAEIRSDRIKENLVLGAQRRSDSLVSPAVYADFRSRARRVLGRRPGPAQNDQLASRFMTLLEAGSDELLAFVSYEEAKEILTKSTKGLSSQVREEMSDYRRTLSQDLQASIPWNDYANATDRLERSQDQKDAARTLLEFDASESENIFQATTRRKLRNLLRDRVITSSIGSAPEVEIARAVSSLGSVPKRISLIDPHPVAPVTSASAARDWITLAVARVRLAETFSKLESEGVEIDGDLIASAFEGLTPTEPHELFAEAGTGESISPLKLKIYSETSSVELSWLPDLDDVALLRMAVVMKEHAAVSFKMSGSPTALGFVSTHEVVAVDTPPQSRQLAQRLQRLASDLLGDGLSAVRLRNWCRDWTDLVNEERGLGGGRSGEHLALFGCVEGSSIGRHRVIGMTALSPLKAEWLADYMDATMTLLDQVLLSVRTEDPAAADALAFDVGAQALRAVTASHYPAFLRLAASDEVMLPSSEGRIWTVFGGDSGVSSYGSHASSAVHDVLLRLLRLQPEAAAHLRCLAMGPGATDLMLKEAIALAGKRVENVDVQRIEVFAIGPHEPSEGTLTIADEHRMSGDTSATVELRYVENLAAARAALGASGPVVHFALVTGLTSEGAQPPTNTVEVQLPEPDTEALFAPRVGQRPNSEQRMLLMPPGPTTVMTAWLRLAQAIDDRWPSQTDRVVVPEMRPGVAAAADELRSVHDLALWVATLDRYATRDSLERALEREVAILHQDKRLGADSPLGLVVSQKTGGPVDRAIGRSLRQARIVNDEGAAVSIGSELRQVAAQGYGILALEAATSGTGINELVGHVVGFSMLGTTSTPWPLPPRCRVVLISLDEHPEWFMGQKRADLLALAIDTEEGGLHGAVIEVKARRSDEERAAGEALDQLKKTLMATSFAAYPRPGNLASRIWLNRIAEALYSVARESSIRLNSEELEAIEAFRRGGSTLEWAGLALVFGPTLEDRRRVHRQVLESDWVPIAIHDIKLTEDRLRAAVSTDLKELFTTESEAQPLAGGRTRRRPELGVPRAERYERSVDEDNFMHHESDRQEHEAEQSQQAPSDEAVHQGTGVRDSDFLPPVLGWDPYSHEPVLWRAAGVGGLSNGHVQIWGSSGAGKTQFVKMLLTQLANGSGAKFGVADFKNDYGPTDSEDFPASVGASFLDLWGRPGAPYNPLALRSRDEVAIDSQVIEFRDSIEQAMAAYQRVGQRQKQAIETALRASYAAAALESRWPTMLDLSQRIGDDIAHILGDLTRYRIFDDGPPLSAVVDQNVVFGLSRIPGNGQTTVLAAAFLLAVISLEMQERPPAPNTIRYALVVDEAHRVAQFRAIQLMLREGRSKGLAVILATQAPSDLPEVVDTNAQTRICFRLSDAVIAGQAARKLDPGDDSLSERIRTLGSGEAFVSLQGGRPQLVTVAQHYRDATRVSSTGVLGEAPPT